MPYKIYKKTSYIITFSKASIRRISKSCDKTLYDNNNISKNKTIKPNSPKYLLKKSLHYHKRLKLTFELET